MRKRKHLKIKNPTTKKILKINIIPASKTGIFFDMYITITSLKLKNIWKFFSLANHALSITKQLKKEQGFLNYKKTGIGLTHYTLSVWENLEDLKRFSRSGAHLNAMKISKDIAAEINTYTYESNDIPNWNTAKELLEKNGKKLVL